MLVSSRAVELFGHCDLEHEAFKKLLLEDCVALGCFEASAFDEGVGKTGELQ